MWNKSLIDSLIGKSPTIWVERIAIIKAINPLEIVRDISFTHGLNIVWGIEMPENPEDASPLILSGHSVGKTTLCRLIRYGLGEQHFGSELQEKAIRNIFETGGICAKVNIENSAWIIYRPFAKNKKSKADRKDDFESVLRGDLPSQSFDAYLDALTKSTINAFPKANLPETNSSYAWTDLLSWLSRDQESRFRTTWEWRSPRSESHERTLKKNQALYLMRIVLGLIHEEEVKIRKHVEDLRFKASQLEGSIIKKRAEPLQKKRECELIVSGIIGQKRENLDNDPESFLSLESLTKGYIDTSRKNQNDLRLQVNELDMDILLLQVSIKSYEDEIDRLRVELNLTTETTSNSFVDYSGKIDKLENSRGGKCTYGGIKFKDCNHFIDYLKRLKTKQLEWERVNSRPLNKESKEEQLAILCSIDSELQNGRQDYIQSIAARNEKQTEKRQKEQELSVLQNSVEAVEGYLRNYLTYRDICEGKIENSELKNLNDLADETASDIAKNETHLLKFKSDYDFNLQSMTNIYDTLIKEILSDSFSGTVQLPGGELQFGIKEDAGFHGEAVETLSLVIADIASMLSAGLMGYHPGFLLHDSPREADLDRHIYDRYFNAILQITNLLGGAEKAPFQYIVTTTSAPPKNLQESKTVRVKLTGYPPTEMLWRRSLRQEEAKQMELFDKEKVMEQFI